MPVEPAESVAAAIAAPDTEEVQGKIKNGSIFGLTDYAAYIAEFEHTHTATLKQTLQLATQMLEKLDELVVTMEEVSRQDGTAALVLFYERLCKEYMQTQMTTKN